MRRTILKERLDDATWVSEEKSDAEVNAVYAAINKLVEPQTSAPSKVEEAVQNNRARLDSSDAPKYDNGGDVWIRNITKSRK